MKQNGRARTPGTNKCPVVTKNCPRATARKVASSKDTKDNVATSRRTAFPFHTLLRRTAPHQGPSSSCFVADPPQWPLPRTAPRICSAAASRPDAAAAKPSRRIKSKSASVHPLTTAEWLPTLSCLFGTTARSETSRLFVLQPRHLAAGFWLLRFLRVWWLQLCVAWCFLALLKQVYTLSLRATRTPSIRC
jgi:hypothetical protein